MPTIEKPVKRFAFTLCLLGGCMVPDTVPTPKPPVGDTLEAVTEKAHRDWLKASAALDDQTAKDVRSGMYKAQSQVVEAYKKVDAEIKDKRNTTVGARIDKDVPPGETLDIEKTAKAYEAQAAGKRRIK
jgi:hypothetical protein